MYICQDCGHIFEEPVGYLDRHGLDSPPYERASACPACCGSFVEAAVCEGCGTCFDDAEGYGLCPNCLSQLRRRFDRVLEANFLPWEAERLRELGLNGVLG